jgi:hypothetical protein
LNAHFLPLSVLIEWLPASLRFMLAAVFDGFLTRIVKTKGFPQHNPEMFALHVCAAINIACATVLDFVLLVTPHPLVFSAVPLAISMLPNRALAGFHLRG